MGKYVNVINGKHIGTSYEEKIRGLLDNGAVEVFTDEFQENLVCVVDNGFFAAAGYAYCEAEFEMFKEPDGRRKRWFTLEDVANIAE
tara:strand:+ start:176 stop:436 length:261 start_codon:yes stop_codon:yes gene_type:complete